MNDHPIKLPTDLADQWYDQWKLNQISFNEMQQLTAQWGADMELEACCECLDQISGRWDLLAELRTARRPKPPNLSRVALLQLDVIRNDLLDVNGERVNLSQIRRALEKLQELEGDNG